MPWTTAQKQGSSGSGCGSVKVGSTGRVSALMTKEMEECGIKRSTQPSSSSSSSSSSSLSQRKLQAQPVSVHCGALPKWRRKTSPSKLSSSGSNGGVAHRHHHHHRRPKTPHAVPMLGAQDDVDDDHIDGRVHVKCGFSKLYDSAAPQEAAAAAASSSSYSLRRLSDLESQFL